MRPYPTPEKRPRPDRRLARHAAVLVGAGVVATGAVLVGAGVALSRVDPFHFELGSLDPGVAEPRWQRLRVFDATTGKTVATRALLPGVAEVPPQFASVRDVDSGSRIVTDRSGVHAEEIATGGIRWTAEFGRPTIGLGPVAGSVVGVVVVGGDSSLTETVFVDVVTGQEAWRTPSGLLSSFAFDPTTNVLYEFGEERVLLARDPIDGSTRWRADRPFGRLYAQGGTVWVAGSGRLTSYDGVTGAVRSDAMIVDLAQGVPVAAFGATVAVAEP